MMKPPLPSKAGSALVMTLLVLVLVTIAVLAFFVKAQSSQQISNLQTSAFSADQFAKDGLNQAIALLRYGTSKTNAAGETNTWSSQPGLITRYGTSSNETIDLHTGASTNGVNLNAPMLQDPAEGTITFDATEEMPLAWIYLRKDGTRTTSTNYTATNPIVGRYAFWVDDNSARVNINTAWTKDATTNTNIAADPSKISLKGAFPNFTNADLATIQTWRETNAFNSPSDILKAFGTNAPVYVDEVKQARFATTHANSSPSSEKTYWGADKIVLTTNPDWAKDEDGNQLPFLDISDYGVTSTKYKATVAMLKDYLSRTDWPQFAGESFQKKFYASSSAYLDQLAVAIIEYVRNRESSEPFLKPVRHSVNSKFTAQGPSRRFRMVECGFWRNDSDTTKGAIYFVLHIPKNSGLVTYTLSGWTLTIDGTPTQTLSIPTTTLNEGEYKLVSIPCAVPSGTVYGCCLIFKEPDGSRFDAYPTNSLSTYANTVNFRITELPPDGSGTKAANPATLRARYIKDPFVAERFDWIDAPANRFADLTNTTTMRNSVGLGSNPTDHELGQDLDASGKLTDTGMIIPPPAGTGWNTSGRVESLAELGRVHTGITHFGTSSTTQAQSAPFRTLRLQPRHPDSTDHLDTLPDWLLLDLFTLPKVPTATPKPETLVSKSGKAGLVNLNSKIEPFTAITRTQALEALLKDNTAFANDTERQTALNNIIDRTIADTSLAKGKLDPSNTYRSIGEIVELEGIADKGETSEARLIGLIDLVTTQGNVFSVYSLGQSLKQTPSGDLIPLAESNQLFMVLRETNSSGDDSFRVIFSKPLSR
ncbi:MAG: hypothetical protein ACK5LK_09250 [Chthoniobacterales bacterium]